MKKLSQKQIVDGVAALNKLRERIIPTYFKTPVEVFKRLLEEHPGATHIKQVLMWDEKRELLTLVNYAEPGASHPENDTNPCPPLCGPG